MLRKYHPDPSHVIQVLDMELRPDLSYEEEPVQILDQDERILRNKHIPMVKVLWSNRSPSDATWETRESMEVQFPHLFSPDKSWVLPSPGALQFNVDGSMFGIERKAGCGGVLRNDTGRILAIFSGPLGNRDSTEAELLAIRHALVMLSESEWRSCPCVIIESDSMVVVS
ncbi:hypothetical protein GQ457_18G011010 [Hibiscus cannabinus]